MPISMRILNQRDQYYMIYVKEINLIQLLLNTLITVLDLKCATNG